MHQTVFLLHAIRPYQPHLRGHLVSATSVAFMFLEAMPAMVFSFPERQSTSMLVYT